jgi:hypothetical protein
MDGVRESMVWPEFPFRVGIFFRWMVNQAWSRRWGYFVVRSNHYGATKKGGSSSPDIKKRFEAFAAAEKACPERSRRVP